MLRAVVLTEYRRVTDGRTDGIAVANTALALRRTLKTFDTGHAISHTLQVGRHVTSRVSRHGFYNRQTMTGETGTDHAHD